MKKPQRGETVGPWARNKLNALDAYLRYYNTALKKQNFTRIYIDAFAGSPLAKIRGDANFTELNPFFDNIETAEAQEEFINGSPLRALEVIPPFHEYYFFDMDQNRVDALNNLKKNYHAKIHVDVGDANSLLRRLGSRINSPNVRGVAFLDPYGAHLEWQTVEMLARSRKIEVIINFPVAMAINRLITKSGEMPPTWRQQLDRCFGTSEWHGIAYSSSPDLFDKDRITKNTRVADLLLDFYCSRLKGIFECVATPRLIRNTRKAPLYYLLWAGPHKLGLTGAEHILSQGEEVRKTT